MAKEKKRIVVKEGGRPCGCYVVEYNDDTQDITPCVACGLIELGNTLGAAGRIAAALGHRVRREQAQMSMMAAVQKAAAKGEDGKKGPQGIITP